MNRPPTGGLFLCHTFEMLSLSFQETLDRVLGGIEAGRGPGHLFVFL